MLIGALVFAISDLAGAYALRSLIAAPGSLPGGEVAAWVYQWIWAPALGIIPLLILMFPDGRILSPRWRFVPLLVGLAVVLMIGPVAGFMWRVRGRDLLVDPDSVPGLEPAFPYFTAAIAAFLVGMIGVVFHQAIRFRRSAGIERQQLKWLVAASAAWACFIVVDMFAGISASSWGSVLSSGMFLLIPASITLAILRHRLYDIDRIVSRTVSWTIVTALLVGAYAAIVFALRDVLPVEGDLAVAASTLAVAGMFNPVRRRVQETVDHRFNRTRYDAVRTIDEFGARLTTEHGLTVVGAELTEIAHRTMDPATVSVWLRGGGRRSAAANRRP